MALQKNSAAKIIIVLIVSFIVFLGGFVLYKVLESRFFPDYKYYGNGAYEKGDYVLPGDWVEVSLNERTVQGMYYIENLTTTLDTARLSNNHAGRRLGRGTIYYDFDGPLSNHL